MPSLLTSLCALFLTAAASAIDAKPSASVSAAAQVLPPVFDLMQYQTPIRRQGDRDTCPYFPPVAALEAAYKRAGYDWAKPFSQLLLNRWNLDPQNISPRVRADERYGIDSYVTLSEADTKKPAKFEEILASGHEIVFSIRIHAKSDESASGQPVWRLKPANAADTLRHYMLIVGYDRPRHFFVVKNQWGPRKYDVKKLAAGWEDVVRYEGYMLVDYNYLAACSEAYYITQVAAVGSPRFTAQRALGQWEISFEQDQKPVMSGVLCWRSLPHHGMSPEPDFRIGDLVTRDGQQFRVNGELKGDGTKPYEITLVMDLKTGAIPASSTDGATWKGSVTLPENGDGEMHLGPALGAQQTAWGVSTEKMSVVAHQNGDVNLLRQMKPTKAE
jgi:hypothetical protein